MKYTYDRLSQLVREDNKARSIIITYDQIGNPLTYRDGMTMTWKDGRKLNTLTKPGLSVGYTYDDSGIRTMKNVNNERTLFYRNGSFIAWQERFNEYGRRLIHLTSSTTQTRMCSDLITTANLQWTK